MHAHPVAAQIYRWTDAEGREHFAQHPSQIPAAHRAAARTAGDEGSLSGFETRAPARPSTRPADPAPMPPPAAVDPAEALAGDEQWWRDRAASHAREIEKAEVRIERCEERDRRRRDASGLTPLDACESERRGLESAEAELGRFEDRARSKDIPPGWLR